MLSWDRGPEISLLSRRVSAARLSNQGYVEQGWLRVFYGGNRASGVAIITRLERIDDVGRPVMQDRFSQDAFTVPVESLSDYFSRLLVRQPAGRYRVFLFYILDKAQSPKQNGAPDTRFT